MNHSREASNHRSALPRVAVMGNNPIIAALIRLIVGDICQVEHCGEASSVGDALDAAPLSALTLLDLGSLPESEGTDCRPATGRSTAPAPVVYVSGAEAQITDDGVPLMNCLANIGRPAEFRAIIELRLRARGRASSLSFQP